MKIKIWADFACPYSYIGEKQLFDIIKKQGLSDKVQVQFLSYQLDPKAPAVPTETMLQHFMHGHEYTEEQSLHLMERITTMAARVGLDYNLSTTPVVSTFDAHRLMEYAQEKYSQSMAVKLNFALFHANFIENLRLSDHAVLLEIAEKCGLNTEEVKAVLNSDQYGAQVKAGEQEIDARPDFDLLLYMLFEDGNVLPGVISPGATKKALSPQG